MGRIASERDFPLGDLLVRKIINYLEATLHHAEHSPGAVMIVNRRALSGLPDHGRHDEALLGVAIQQMARIALLRGPHRLGREERTRFQQAFESRLGGVDEVPPACAFLINTRKLIREAGDGCAGCDGCVHGDLLGLRKSM